MVGRRNRDMDDWDDDFFDDFFSDFGIDINKINERMKRIWDRLLRDPDVRTYGPYVYGFTYKVGPDGRPVFEEFGNLPGMRVPGLGQPVEKDVREPITDLNVDRDKVYVTYELPGVAKENIKLNVTENNITLDVREGPRKYFKSMDFDFKLKPNTARAKFTNGILDVTVEKEGGSTGSGRTVTIE
ncbi:heat-shock protein Hsp20 [Thermogymnomonas acidicola]|uniref:Heat-shock protein Hsp20 n=1 Tax=Thermogymnomonas acidicola TaxID=399579 RepID=A0AA37F9F1_9ARCH|nr:archaeal heat shock protein Hsp20 [Thermogymnomonas acidicola]GGM73852.1 heat-shock protein Hsp20 [Thermogymnomonas acidicola]